MEKEIKNIEIIVEYARVKHWEHIVSVVRKALQTNILVLEEDNKID